MIIGVASADRLPSSRSVDGRSYWGGSGWIRIGQYIPYWPHTVVLGYLSWSNGFFKIIDDEGVEYEPDIVIMQRLMMDGLARHAKMARANGQKIVNDVDDWYWGLSTKNLAWKMSHPKENAKENVNFYKGIIASSDVVTVSTPYLRERLSTTVSSPFVIIDNTVDIKRFNKRQHTDDGVPFLGWAGSTAHRSGDLETVASVLRKVHNNGDYRLMHIGHADAYTSFAATIGVSEDAVQTTNLLPADEYPAALVMDVGIVPLNNVPFNRAKSDIKGLEYAAAGVPFVAQNLDAYMSLKNNYGIGRIAKHPADWLKHLNALRDVKVRQEESDRNWELVQQRDVAIGAKRWLDLLESL